MMASINMTSTKISSLGWNGGGQKKLRNKRVIVVSAQEEQVEGDKEVKAPPKLRPVEPQKNVKSRVMGKEFKSEWLSSVTRHVRIFAAYVDPETLNFDQSQVDKLTLILDPSKEFVWTQDTANKVFAYFQELVDHYEGAPLTEYTLRLIGSDLEHYIRKMLYDGEIKYNMDARVLNFSMGKPRIMFNHNNQDVQ